MKAVPIVAYVLVVFVMFASNAVAQVRTAPTCDASPRAVQLDQASLREAVIEALRFLFNDPSGGRVQSLAATIEIEYIGPGHMVPAPADSLERPPGGSSREASPPRITSWIGVNPATCNQFRMRVPAESGRLISSRAKGIGLGRADPGRGSLALRARDWLEPIQEQYGPPQTGPYFSGCQDTRIRSATLGYPMRTVANFSADGQMSSCTGTLVGPRHILTAGHCLFQGGNIWHDFTVIPGRDASVWPFGSTLMSDTQGLNQGFRWYWIPDAAYTQFPDWYSGLDIGIIVIPQRLGDVTGWMGVVGQSETTLIAAWHKNLGYPGGSGGPIGVHPVHYEGAMYGDMNACDVGDFSNYDAQGWARLAGHSCDNSSGHSGGPIYQWVWDAPIQAVAPAVSLITSHHPAFVNDFDCANNPRPYSATRITAEYIDSFSFFRSWKP